MQFPRFNSSWRKRWVQLGNSATLHRVATTVPPTPEQWAETELQWAEMGLQPQSVAERDDWQADGYVPVGIQGTTACGLSGRLGMPGIFSRMGAPRCKRCCKRVGIPAGDGAPFNDKSLSKEQQEA